MGLRLQLRQGDGAGLMVLVVPEDGEGVRYDDVGEALILRD